MVHDNESDSVSVDVSSIPEPLQVTFQPSKLSLLLLHVNDEKQLQTFISSIVDAANNDCNTFEIGSAPVYNPFYSADVNVIKYIKPAKFLPCETSDDKKENLAWTTCNPVGNIYLSYCGNLNICSCVIQTCS